MDRSGRTAKRVSQIDQRPPLRVLALESYYGGSHQSFLEGWIKHSCHHWELLKLPAHHWKWRMRHSAIHFARQLNRPASQLDYDVVFVTDMVNLAEFRGLAPRPIADAPMVLYFHENQLTYPVRQPDPRDLHFGFSNYISCLAATEVWFNSGFHRDEFFAAVEQLVRKIPNSDERDAITAIKQRSQVAYPGIEDGPTAQSARRPGPLRIVWAARWEHDKGPAEFFQAIDLLTARGIPFELAVLGQSFRETPDEFAAAHERFRDQIYRWGYAPSRDDYLRTLAWADVFVSTARHEFFGLSLVEAIQAGCHPLAPHRLSYPEVLRQTLGTESSACLYDGTPADLAAHLENCAKAVKAQPAQRIAATMDPARLAAFTWPARTGELDAGLERVAGQSIVTGDPSVPATGHQGVESDSTS